VEPRKEERKKERKKEIWEDKTLNRMVEGFPEFDLFLSYILASYISTFRP
jgi:hypothetical protein